MGLTHTVSGDIASFRTPSRVPIESLKFHFLPKQASGTPTPANPIPIEGWTGLNGRRAGKNIGHVIGYSASSMNSPAASKVLTNYYGTTVGTRDYTLPDTPLVITQEQTSSWDPSNPISYKNGYFCIGFDNLIFDKFYDFSFKITNVIANPLNVQLNNIRLNTPGGSQKVCSEVKNGNILIYKNMKWEQYTSRPEDSNRCTLEFRNCGMSFTLSEIMVTPANKTDGVFEPYSGEQIPITFPVAGTNKLDPNDIDVYARFELVNGVYRNTDVDTRTTIQLSVQLWKTTGTYIKTAKVDYVTTIGRHAITFDVDEPECQYIVLKHNGMKKDFILIFPRRLGFGTFTISCDVLANDPTTIGGIQLTNIQLEVGDTAHTFEPYSSDNTFYGGYIDPVAGEIVAEYALAVAKKENFGEKITPTSGGMECRQTGNIYSPTESGVTWSVARQQQKFNFGVIANPWSETAYGNNIGVVITQSNYNLTYMRISETVYQAMGNDDLATISYKLETPIHIPIPAEDMKAFLDHNNFWSDANDITEVTYAVTESKDMLATRKKTVAFDHAHHKKVKWNQHCYPLTSEYWAGYTDDRVSVSFNNGIATSTWLTTDIEYSTSVRLNYNIAPSQITNDIWYGSYLVNPSKAGLKWGIEMCGGQQLTDDIVKPANEWSLCSFIAPVKRNNRNTIYISNVKTTNGADIGMTAQVKAPIHINLTQMFGAGKEPATVEEFERICAINGIDLTTYQPYDAGSDRWLIIP